MPHPRDAQPNGPPTLDPEVIAAIRGLTAEGGENALLVLTHVFMADAPEQMATLRSALDRGDGDTAWKTAHLLRGTAGGIGAAAMGDLCAVLEQHARGGALDQARALWPRLEQAHADAAAALTKETR